MKNKIDFVLRVILAGVFLISGLLKLLSFDTFVYSIKTYDILTHDTIIYFAITIISLEIFAGIMILLNIYSKIAAILVVILMTSFTIFVVWSVIADKGFICNCFGSLFSTKINYVTIIRNTCLLVLAIYVYKNPSTSFDFDKLTKKQTVIVILMSFILLSCIIIYNNYYRVPLKEFHIGKTIEDYELISMDGQVFNSHNINKPFTLLVFFDTRDCSKCLSDAILWKKVYKEFSSFVEVILIFVPRSVNEIQKTLKQKSLKMPYIVDYKLEWFSKYNIITPLRVLLDKNNKVIHIGKPDGMLESQNAFINLLLNEIKNIKTQSPK